MWEMEWTPGMMHLTRWPGYFSLVAHGAKMKFDIPARQTSRQEPTRG